MFSFTCHRVCDHGRSARLDVVKQKAPVHDFLVNRPSSLRASLKEQWELGERCAPLVYQMAGMCMLVLGSECFGTCMGYAQKLHGDACRGVGDSLLVNAYLSTGNQYAVPKSDATLRLELEKAGLATVPGLLDGFRPFAAPYVVDMSVGTCTCRQFATTNIPCKHIFGVLKSTGKRCSSLPSSILSNPWLNIDFKVILKPTRCKALLSPTCIIVCFGATLVLCM